MGVGRKDGDTMQEKGRMAGLGQKRSGKARSGEEPVIIRLNPP